MIVSLVALLAACGSDHGGTDSGSGTHTQRVQGRASWEDRVSLIVVNPYN